jgi:hypothetical protein
MKPRLMAVGAVVAALTLPATAGAAGTVSGGPVKAGDYDLSLTATDAKKDTLTIILERGTQARGENVVLNFTRGVRVTVRGSTATIKGTLGSRGSVDLRLQGAGAPSRGKLPKGCTGSPGTTRTGRLVGKLRLRLPDGKFVTIRSLPGASHVGADLECRSTDNRPGGDGDGDGGDGDGEPRLMATGDSEGATFSFMATKRALTLNRIVPAQRDRGTTVMAVNSAHATGSNLLTVSGGGSRATVAPAGAFGGTGLFTATMNAGSMAMGPLTGSLRVKLAGVPIISITSEQATLLNADKA